MIRILVNNKNWITTRGNASSRFPFGFPRNKPPRIVQIPEAKVAVKAKWKNPLQSKTIDSIDAKKNIRKLAGRN
ncbi:hypothetical protein LEP1GSC163_1785 [Leptospira santarosai str. CBC379]|nr:hypothetical protein LEP1GSC163_1785 [Leptospira santarosai str. CBC379]